MHMANISQRHDKLRSLNRFHVLEEVLDFVLDPHDLHLLSIVNLQDELERLTTKMEDKGRISLPRERCKRFEAVTPRLTLTISPT